MKNTNSLWRAYTLAVCSLFLSFFASAQTHNPRYVTTSPRSNAFYEYLPQGYSSTGSQTYPLMVFIHGNGELGAGNSSTISAVLRNGPAKMINQGTFPTSFTVNGATHKFIVISPQFTVRPTADDINQLFNYLVQNYKVDQSRIYLTGLSMGGGSTWDYVSANSTYANRMAAIVPICGHVWPDPVNAAIMANADLPVWATHNSGDATVPSYFTVDLVNYINASPNPPTPLAKKTIFTSNSHDAWSQTYNLNFRENGLNVFEWMLTYTRGGSTPANTPPSVNAGIDKTITLPVSNLTLTGTASDPGGSVSTVQWSKISGPASAVIQSPSSLTSNISNLTQGTYIFRLTATDNSNTTSSDDVTVIVNPAPNQAPVANAGSDKTITLPVNTISVTGVGTDADGSIVSYAWTKVSGPAGGSIGSASTANTSFNALIQGVYVFRLTVADNSGATSSDDIIITVNQAASNQLPVANAGTDLSITLPVNSANLSGTGSDADGSITSYTWTKVSGPSANISNASSASTAVNSLITGTYIFRLTVTDNSGASASDDLSITVNPSSAPSPDGAAVKVNIYGGVNPFNNAEWNNWNTTSSLNSSLFNYTDQSPSGISATINSQGGVADNGAGYGSGATIVPGDVLRYNSYSLENRILTIKGLNTSSKYKIQLFGSRNNGVNISVFQIGSNSQSINTSNNITDFPVFTNLSPSSTGTITINIDHTGGYTYLAGFIITNETGGIIGNVLPTSNAGADASITLPSNSITLSGNGTDPDGTIASYLWTKVSGPSTGGIATPDKATTVINNLSQGTYVYRLTVTDNRGGTASDNINIIVNAAPVIVPSSGTINVNVFGGTNAFSNTQWNNWNTNTLSSGAFKYTDETMSTVTATLSSQTGVADNGGSYLTNATAVPYQVLRYNSYSLSNRTLTIKGLVPGSDYNLKLYASRNNGETYTVFQSGTDSRRINTSFNISNFPEFSNVKAATNGTITVSINATGGYTYFAGFTLSTASATRSGISTGSSEHNTITNEQNDPELVVVYDVNVFPNPVQNVVTVTTTIPSENKPMMMTMVDMLGKVVMQKEIRAARKTEITQFDMSSLKEGVYILSVKTGNKTISRRIIKGQ